MTEIREFQFDVMIRLPKGSPDIEDVVDRLLTASGPVDQLAYRSSEKCRICRPYSEQGG
jgi:hypothetical protein